MVLQIRDNSNKSVASSKRKMNDGEQMPKVDRAALKNADETFMKIIERENILRVAKLKRTRRQVSQLF